MHVPNALCCRHSAARGYCLASHQVPVKKRPRNRCSMQRLFDALLKCAVSLKIYTMVCVAVLFTVLERLYQHVQGMRLWHLPRNICVWTFVAFVSLEGEICTFCVRVYVLYVPFSVVLVCDFVICLCLGATSAGQLALQNQIPFFGQISQYICLVWYQGSHKICCCWRVDHGACTSRVFYH